VNRDYDCLCLGKKVINTPAKVVLTFIISIIAIVFCFVFMLVKGDVIIFAPIVALIVGFWVPSPVQTSQSRKDAIQSERLLQNNLRMNRTMMRYGMLAPRFGNNLGATDLETGQHQPRGQEGMNDRNQVGSETRNY
jgi:hypothetical protein